MQGQYAIKEALALTFWEPHRYTADESWGENFYRFGVEPALMGDPSSYLLVVWINRAGRGGWYRWDSHRMGEGGEERLDAYLSGAGVA